METSEADPQDKSTEVLWRVGKVVFVDTRKDCLERGSISEDETLTLTVVLMVFVAVLVSSKCLHLLYFKRGGGFRKIITQSRGFVVLIFSSNVKLNPPLQPPLFQRSDCRESKIYAREHMT